MRRIDVAERRARLAGRHHLAPEARSVDPVATARDLVGLHATDPMTVYLAAAARTAGLTAERMSSALYDERTLLRIVGMRTTMFVVPRDIAAEVQAACTRVTGRRERTRLVKWLASAGIGDDHGTWLQDVESRTVTALADLGEATAAELTAAVPELGTQIPFGEGRSWQGTVGVSTRILFLLAADGRIVRGRPRGTIVSSLYRWTTMEGWIPGGLPALPEDDARAALLRRWLAAYGPGTEGDLRWWTGWPLRDVRRALAGLETVEVDLDGRTGLVLAGDDVPAAASPGARPWLAMLPSLDPTTMGWTGRDWYLGGHRKALFDRNGNAGPTVWWNGRVVGGWAQRADGEIVVRLLEDIGADGRRMAQLEAAALQAWLGQVRVVPRFRTPVEADLAR